MAYNDGNFDPFQGDVPEPKPDDGKGKDGDKGDDKPDLQALLDQERKAREAAEQKWAEREAIYDQRLEQFGNILSDKSTAKADAQTPEPEPDVTDADFDKSPSAATRATVNKEVKEVVGKVNEYYSGVIGNLAEQAFEAQIENLRDKRFWEYVGPEVEEFFEKNPQAKLSPKAASTIYDQYVGNGITHGDLLEREAADKEAREQEDLVTGGDPHRNNRRARVPSDGPRTPAPRMPTDGGGAKVKLTNQEQELLDIYKRYGIFEDEADWDNWKQTIGFQDRPDIDLTLQEGR